jgi:hypothetical protein
MTQGMRAETIRYRAASKIDSALLTGLRSRGKFLNKPPPEA